MTAADQLAIAKGCYFSEEHADRIIRFAEKYVVPQFITGNFRLLDWQKDWLRQLYGWRNADGSKRFKRACLHVAKKNGKTLLVSIIALYELLFSENPSPLVVSASTSRENATQVFKELHHTIAVNPLLNYGKSGKKRVIRPVPSQKRLYYDSKNGEYRAISCDAGSAEGLNVSACIIDEAHAHKSDKLYRSLEYSIAARQDATLIVISTAGNDVSHWYYQLYQKAKRVLSGDDSDHTFFATVFEIPECHNLESPESWPLANPSLGVSFTADAFRQDLQAAKSDTGSWLSFQRYRLNRWLSGSEESYLDVLKWDQCLKSVSAEQLAQAPCYLGVDLSQSVDPSSITAVWCLPDRRYHVASWAFVAEEGVRRREGSNLPRYNQFVSEGSMHVTSGNMIDAAILKAKIIDLARDNRIEAVVFDQYSAYVLASEVGNCGLTVYRSPMTYRYVSEPTKEFCRAVYEGRVSHDGGSWLRWCLSCTRLGTDSYGNVRPDREKSCKNGGHIDGTVSTILAFGQILSDTVSHQLEPRKSIYDDSPIFVV